MSPPGPLRIADLRGIARLLAQSTEGVTDIVEGVHQAVWQTLGVPGPAPGRTGGISGQVYRSIHAITRGVAGASDWLLGGLQARLDQDDDRSLGSRQRLALLSALNGVIGDRLAEDGNPLAINMSLQHRQHALDWHAGTTPTEVSGKLLILIHGLCMNDRQWGSASIDGGFDHGEALAAAHGYTPLYLRYNSGRHVSENGRELSAQLQALVAHWPVPIERLTLLAHSMGGLVARSAVHHAQTTESTWLAPLRDLIFLGTPHHGAPLERAGNWVDTALGGSQLTAPFASLGQIRSAGITDLRHGHVLDSDWQGRDRFRRATDPRTVLPLPGGIDCHTVAATTSSRRSALADRLTGDGLVPLHSALGQHDNADHCLAFAPDSQWIAYRTHHMQLLHSPTVAEQLQKWLAPSASSE